MNYRSLLVAVLFCISTVGMAMASDCNVQSLPKGGVAKTRVAVYLDFLNPGPAVWNLFRDEMKKKYPEDKIKSVQVSKKRDLKGALTNLLSNNEVISDMVFNSHGGHDEEGSFLSAEDEEIFFNTLPADYSGNRSQELAILNEESSDLFSGIRGRFENCQVLLEGCRLVSEDVTRAMAQAEAYSYVLGLNNASVYFNTNSGIGDIRPFKPVWNTCWDIAGVFSSLLVGGGLYWYKGTFDPQLFYASVPLVLPIVSRCAFANFGKCFKSRGFQFVYSQGNVKQMKKATRNECYNEMLSVTPMPASEMEYVRFPIEPAHLLEIPIDAKVPSEEENAKR